jgi:hypothetical protein
MHDHENGELNEGGSNTQTLWHLDTTICSKGFRAVQFSTSFLSKSLGDMVGQEPGHRALLLSMDLSLYRPVHILDLSSVLAFTYA